jgi:hypothetical protein
MDCGEIFNSKKEYVDHVKVDTDSEEDSNNENAMPCPGPSQSWLQGKGTRRKRNEEPFVTDVAAPEDIIEFLDVTRGEDNRESWFKAYRRLFPKAPRPASCSRPLFLAEFLKRIASLIETTSSVSG